MPLDEGGKDITPAARRALLAASVGYAVDGFDLLVLGFMLEPIAASLSVDRLSASALVTWTLVGLKRWSIRPSKRVSNYVQ